jgi:hypothetical protein
MWGEDSVRPDCCTEHLNELLVFADELLERHGILHWLDFGALLGAVRSGEFVPWDADVDFGVLDTDLDAILALRPEVEAAGHRLVQDGPIVRLEYSEANGAHLDLWPWSERNGALESACVEYDWPGMAGGRINFPAAYLEAREPVVLYGRRFLAPAPIAQFLVEHRYGPDYMTPRRSLGYCFRLRFQIPSEELTPAVQDAVDAVGAGDARLGALLSASRLSRSSVAWRWQVSGLPVAPERRRLERIRGLYAAEGSSPVLDALTASLALLEQAIDEVEHPRPALLVRRLVRRAVRAGEVVRAALAGRPHRAGFPFGEPPTLAARQAG